MRLRLALSQPAIAPQSPLSTLPQRWELVALFAFAFVLPLFEAPKNLLWFIYAGLWTANRWRARDFGGPWDKWDALILVWIASGFASAAFAGLHHDEWHAALDIFRYASVLWFLRRSGYGERALAGLLACTVSGTLAALAWGCYGLWVQGREYLELNSVGQVNHGAIYVAVTFGASLAWSRATWQRLAIAKPLAGAVICLMLALSMIEMQSRAVVAAGFVMAFVILGVYSLRARHSVRNVILATIAIAALLFVTDAEVVRKNTVRLAQDVFVAPRDAIWRAGLDAWRQFPYFGVGMGNYSRIDYAHLEEWKRARGEPFERTQVMPTSHAHSLYVNTLAERGLAGFVVLLAVLAAWGWSLARSPPAADDSAVRWSCWGGALAAWLVAVLVGVVNTTLHHEHAIVSMLLLGGWMALRSRPSRPEAAGK